MADQKQNSQPQPTEEELRVCVTGFKLAQQMAHIGNWEWDIETNRVFWSDELFRIYGYQPQEIAPDYGLVIAAMHPDSKQQFLAAIDAALTENRHFEMDYSFYRKDGSVAFLHTIGAVTRNATGRPIRMEGTVQDITERKAMEDALRLSEEKFRSIFNNASDGMLIASVASKKFLAANRSMCDMLGYSAQEMLQLGIDAVHPISELPRVHAEFEKQIRGEIRIVEDLPMLRKDGSVFRADISATSLVINGERCALGIFRDVTGRKKVDDALRLQGEITGNIAEGIYLVRAEDLAIVYANRKMEELFGYNPGELNGRHVSVLNAATDANPAETAARIGQALAKAGTWRGEVLNIRKDGTVFWGHSTISTMHHSEYGNVYVSLQSDITERKKIESDLELFKKLLNRSNDALFVNDPQTGRFIDANDRACTSLGYARDELLQKTVQDIELNFPHDVAWQDHVAEVRQHGSLLLEGVHCRKDGTQFPVETSVSFVKAEAGEYMVAVVRDITERKAADAALRERERQLAESQRIAHIGSWEHNLTTGRAIWSDELFRILGLDPRKDRADFAMFFEMIHPEDRSTLKNAIDATVKTGRQFSVDYRFVLRDGTTKTLQAQAELTNNGNGAHLVLSGTAQDITVRKQAEEEIAERNVLLKQIMDTTSVGIGMVDKTGRFTHVNKRMETLFGCTAAELTGSEYFSWVHPSEREVSRRNVRALLAHDMPSLEVDRMYQRRDGTSFWGHLVCNRSYDARGNSLGIIGTIMDITGRKTAEDALRESENRLNMILDNVGAHIFIKDTHYRYTYANRKVAELFGRRPEEIVGKTDEDFFPRASAEEIKRSDRPVIERGETISREEDGLSASDGKPRTYWTTKLPLRDTAGAIIGLCGISTDISARKDAEEKIRQSDQFIRSILDTVDEGFIVIDPDYRILTANKAYCGQAGFAACDEVIGKHCYEVSHGISRPCYEEGEDCAVRQVFASGQPHKALHKHIDKDGHILYVETKGFPIRDESGRVTSVIETINNITEKHLLEEERLKTQKLESIGTLAGGIAHDFNNLLQGIFGYISLAKMKIGDREKSLTALEQAEKALHQSVNLTTQLLTFSKGGKPVKKPVELGPVVENAVKFALSGSRSDYRISIDNGLWHTEADEGQISQVIQNIVLNADQAMPVAGTILVNARNAAAGDNSLPPVLGTGNYVLISIADTGIGIPEQYLDKIFDPYFTTKEKGSGLGLATSYSIIRNHGGLIDVRTRSGEGSTFLIYLPAFTGEAMSAPREQAAPQAALRHANVLVMDDDEIIRELSSEMLKMLGHTAKTVRNGNEAVETYHAAMAEGKPFDIVILDVTVRGGMGGMETAERLRKLEPGVKMIVSSGYSDDAATSNYRNKGFQEYLCKPYDIDELRDRVNALLA